MSLRTEVKEANFNVNDEFPAEKDILNESFDSEDQKTPEEVKNNINNFWTLDPLRQKKYVKNFSSICQLLGNGEFQFIIEKMYAPEKKSLEARPELTNLLIENFQLLFKILSNNPFFAEDVSKKYQIERIVLAFVNELIESSVSNLLVISRRSLVKLGPLLSKQCCDNDLLSIILTLLHDPKNESNNTSALELIKQMNTLFSDEYIRGFIAMDIIALLQSPSVNIRIEACHSLFSLFHVFTSKFVEERFVSVIEGLTKDPNNAVINHLIKNMPVLAKKISFNEFEKRFFPRFMEYLNSKNRFQREESLVVLGALIVALTESEEEAHVFAVYSSVSFEKLLETFFDLPKVIAKMNLSTKRNIIKSNYSLLNQIVHLKKNDIWAKIKKLILATEEIESVLIEIAKVEISLQLHSIAKICDKITLEKDLILIIDRYYLTINPSTSQTVKQNTIKVLSEVLKELSPEIREKYADVYQTTLNLEVNKWRLRYVISEQIEALSKIFSSETIFAKIIPMYFSFCRDNCAVVRKSASKLFHKLYSNIMSDETLKQIALINMKSFGSYNRFVLRQSFVLMAECLLINVPQEVDQEIIEILINLSKDKVVNVRLTVARLLLNLHKNQRHFEFVDKIRAGLLEKVDNDMYQLLEETLPSEMKELLNQRFNENKENKLKLRQAEKIRVDSLKNPNQDRRNFMNQYQDNKKEDIAPKIVASNSYREMLKNAFEIEKNDNAKDLIEDLDLGETNSELDLKFSSKDEVLRDGILKPFVDIDLKAEPIPAPLVEEIITSKDDEKQDNIEKLSDVILDEKKEDLKHENEDKVEEEKQGKEKEDEILQNNESMEDN